MTSLPPARFLLACALLAISACKAPQGNNQDPGPPPKPEYLSASGEVSSWGAPVRRWNVDSDGRAEIIENTPLARHPTETTTIFNLDLKQKAELRYKLIQLAAYSGRKIECGAVSSDPPYGQVRLNTDTSSDVIHFTVGCPAAEAKKLEAAVDEVSEFLWAASKNGLKVSRKFGPDRRP